MKQLHKRVLLFTAFLFFIVGIGPVVTQGGFRTLGALSVSVALGLLTLVFLLQLKTKHSKAAKVLLRLYCIALCVLLIASVITGAAIGKCALGDPDFSGKYILVLGAGVNGTAPSLSLQNRIDAAADYLISHPETVCIASGGLGTTASISEAECISSYLQKLGISEDRIWKEENATTTKENIKYAIDLIEERTGEAPSQLGIVSSEYHLFRAKFFAQNLGIQGYGIPAKTTWLSLKVNYFLREIIAVWYYYMIGG